MDSSLKSVKPLTKSYPHLRVAFPTGRYYRSEVHDLGGNTPTVSPQEGLSGVKVISRSPVTSAHLSDSPTSRGALLPVSDRSGPQRHTPTCICIIV